LLASLLAFFGDLGGSTWFDLLAEQLDTRELAPPIVTKSRNWNV